MTVQTVQTTAVFTRYRMDAVPGRYSHVAWRYYYEAKGLLPDGRPFHTDQPSKAECRAWARRVGMVAAFLEMTA